MSDALHIDQPVWVFVQPVWIPGSINMTPGPNDSRYLVEIHVNDLHRFPDHTDPAMLTAVPSIIGWVVRKPREQIRTEDEHARMTLTQ